MIIILDLFTMKKNKLSLLSRSRLTAILFLSLGIFVFVACGSKRTSQDAVSGKKSKKHIVAKIPSADRATDLALIYMGYKNRPAWNTSDMKPYIFRNNDGKVEWLFDGFLFLEIYGNVPGREKEYAFDIESHGRIPAGKFEWNYLLEKTFADGVGPDAIEATIDSLVQLGIKPPYKRKVMFALPNPQVQCKNWGELNGKIPNFDNVEDRLEAVKWYVSRIFEEWGKKDYKYIDIAGFYWLHEQIDSKYKDDILIKDVQAYLNSIGYPLTWIPYYGAAGADRWNEMGFDIAYQQPNYFFNAKSPITIITGAIEFARKHDMSLEMEFDDRIKDPVFRERFYTYLDQFEKAGAWDYFPIAYYEGGGAWLRMYRSEDPEVQKAYNALADILVKRSGKFSKIKK